MASFREQMRENMTVAMTVSSLKDILEELVKDGHGDAIMGFRLGHLEDSIYAVNFPFADICMDKVTGNIFITPAPPIQDAETKKVIPKFDFSVTIDGEEATLKFTKPEPGISQFIVEHEFDGTTTITTIEKEM